MYVKIKEEGGGMLKPAIQLHGSGRVTHQNIIIPNANNLLLGTAWINIYLVSISLSAFGSLNIFLPFAQLEKLPLF